MADIREILAALSDDDKAMYTQHRNEMRRSYMVAHNETVGMDKWAETDDQFLDYIDIMLAVLYDRAGRLMATKEILGDDKSKIEKDIDAVEDNLKKINVTTENKGWANGAGVKQ